MAKKLKIESCLGCPNFSILHADEVICDYGYDQSFLIGTLEEARKEKFISEFCPLEDYEENKCN